MLDASISFADFHEREIWWCSIGVNVGSEQHSQTDDFSRPVIIIRRFTRDIFLGIPLTTKVREHLSFRVRIVAGDHENDALLLQMRTYDRRRLVRKIGTISVQEFATLTNAVINAIKTTDPAFAGSSEAEANVYKQGYTKPPKKSIGTEAGVDNEKSV